MRLYSFSVWCGIVHLILSDVSYKLTLASDCVQTNSLDDDYTGRADTTITGQPCIAWTSLTGCPQNVQWQNNSLSENYCRNPAPDRCHQDQRTSPWCYTGQGSGDWDYCDIPRCDDPSGSCSLALGMGNGAIEDSQITASSSDNSYYGPAFARINSSNYQFWMPACCGDKNDIKVDLLRPHVITKLYIQGTRSGYVKTFFVLYSMDDLVWTGYSDMPDGTTKEFIDNEEDKIVPIYFERPFTAVKIAIVPLTWYYRPAIKMEIFGCLSNATVPPSTEITQITTGSMDRWTSDKSPYVVRQLLSVPVGSSLTVEAGVKVVFADKEAGLNIAGCIQLNGLNGFEIQFVSNNLLSLVFNTDDKMNPFWQGLAFKPSSSACTNVEIAHLVVTGANKGLELVVNQLRLSNVTIRNSRTAVAVTPIDSTANATFETCIFDGNYNGITMDSSGRVDFQVLASVFLNNTYAVQFGFNKTGNGGKASSVLESSSVKIRWNRLVGGQIVLALVGPRLLEISQNMFNVSNGVPLRIELQRNNDSSASKQANNAVSVTDNGFRDNRGDNAVSISCSSNTFYEYVASVSVSRNMFKGNFGRYVVTSNCRGIYLTENVFLDGNASFEYQTSASYSTSLQLYATGNFWNASGYDNVMSRIYDHQVDPSVASVEVYPWFSDVNMTSFGTVGNSFFSSDGLEIGGTIDEDTTLANNGQPYIVSADILVPPGVTFSIESGVQLIFKQTGITVEGTLLAQGTESNWISMRPESSTGSWKGISFKQEFAEEVRWDDSGLWEILVNSEWRYVEYYGDAAVAEMLCKQAGFYGVQDYEPVNCSAGLASSAALCSAASKRVRVFCGSYVNSVSECDIQYSDTTTNDLLQLSCSKQNPQTSRTINKIVTYTGVEVRASADDNLVAGNEDGSRLSDLFIPISPCLADSSISNCVSLMSLSKPGWFLRHFGQNELLLEPKTNPRNSTTFASDASFILRQDRFLSGYVAFESVNLPNYFVSVVSGTNGLIALQMMDNSNAFREAASFQLVEQKTSAKRKRRDVTTTDDNTSFLKYVRISYATVGITIEGKAPALENIIVENSTVNGIFQTGYAFGNFTLTDSEILYNKGSGIVLKTNIYTYASQVSIVGCKIIGNSLQGITAIVKSNLTITRCTVRQNADIGLSISPLSSPTSTIFAVESSEISYHQRNAVFCTGYCIIRNNSIIQNSFNRALNLQNGNFTVEGNLVENNFVSAYFQDSVIYVFNGPLTFRNNIVRNNRARSSMSVVSENAVVVVTGNIFVNSTIYNYFTEFDNAFEVLSTKASINNNVFDNPSIAHDVRINSYRGINYDLEPIDLSMNFWNRKNYSGISERIDCFFNSMDKMPVNIWPSILDIATHSLLTLPADSSHFSEAGLGGDVYSSVRIESRDLPYIVNRSIYIETGASIVVEAGVVLQFQPGRGIYVRGTMILQGTADSPVTFTQSSTSGWYGIIIVRPFASNVTNETVTLSHAVLNGSTQIAYVTAPLIEIASLTVTLQTDMGLSLEGGNITIQNSSFASKSNQYGLMLSRSAWSLNSVKNITVTNSTFSSSSTGLFISGQDFVSVADSFFIWNDYGMNIFPAYAYAYKYTIRRCKFTRNAQAIYSNYGSSGIIEIFDSHVSDNSVSSSGVASRAISISTNNLTMQNNTFANLTNGGVVLDFFQGTSSLLSVTVKDNTFVGISGAVLDMTSAPFTQTTVENNTFAMNSINNASSAVRIGLSLNSGGPGNLTILRNTFKQNSGSDYVLRFQTGTNNARLPCSVKSNRFFDNHARDSVVHTDYYLINVSFNVFENPGAPYEFRIGFPNGAEENCTFNWWGSADRQEVASRIFDHNRDPSLGLVVYEPFLNASEFSCEEVSGCSGNGFCVFQDTCECEDGWQGAECSLLSCASVSECSGRGTCVGPNTCECSEGWVGSDCSKASCSGREGCNGHGNCVAPNQCLCSPTFVGDNCSECSEDAWGPSCNLCPQCVHGECDKETGDCACESENWSGDLCDVCAPTFSGPDCLTPTVGDTQATRRNSIRTTPPRPSTPARSTPSRSPIVGRSTPKALQNVQTPNSH